MRTRLSWIVGISFCLITSPAWSQVAENPIVVAQARTATTTAVAEGEQDNANRVNNWTIGVAGGLLEGSFIRFAAELAKALDDSERLRVLPIVTYGAAENVNDLLYLKGVDVAITHADVFEEYKANHKYGNIDKRINYISEMYISELHVYARPEIKSMKDLAGKKIGFNTKGSAPTITGKILFQRLGINVEPVFINHALALEKMKTGEFAAIVHAVGKPNDLFKKESGENGFHFLPIEFNEKFSDYYVPTAIGHDDYPNLIKDGETINTIGVPVVLAVYNWPQGSDRHRRVERFIQYYFERFETLRKPPFHAKWQEINLAAKVPGWTRYWVAENMLGKTALMTPSGFSATAATSGQVSSEPTEQELFREFTAWKKTQRK
jgi:TRAP-type uncharacterized transport system substrate-binding protein